MQKRKKVRTFQSVKRAEFSNGRDNLQDQGS